MTRLALLSPCGHGNLGDAAIQEAVIANLRARVADVSFVGITLRPADTEARHGIPAYPLGGSSTAGYTIEEGRDEPESGDEGADAPGPPAAVGRSDGIGLLAPVVALARMLLPKGTLWRLRCELKHLRGAIRLVKSVDALVVSGGGQLDEYWGGPWGHPYALLKWSLLARWFGRRVTVLSVGYGTLDSRLSRIFVRRALRLAAYRSYRDEGSRQLMQKAGFRVEDPVVPDLAFSLRGHGLGVQRSSGAAMLIGVSPIAYCDPRVWPKPNAAVYANYLDRLAALSVALLDAGYELMLLASDSPDHDSVQDLAQRIEAARGARARVRVPNVRTVETFIDAAKQCDVVIASRLHGVLLAQLALTPVLALSYDRKVAELMRNLDKSRYCVGIEAFDPADCMNLTVDLRARHSEVQRELARDIDGYRAELDAQYERFAATLLVTPAVPTPAS